jgi:LysR family transcriptional regulator, low CO2-responsive transcriptional regulator
VPAGRLAMNRRHITLRQLDIFQAVARHGGFTRAADALHLTQPAVSLQMQKLAESVGHPLFESRGRSMVLTEAGHELLRTCQTIDDAWGRFAAAIDARTALESGRLRVSVVTTAKYFLPRRLGEFCKVHPGIDVELEVGNRERILGRLREGIDDLYVMGVPPDDLDVESEPFMDNELVVIAPADDALPSSGKLPLAELAGRPFILREPGSGTRRQIDRFLAERRLRLDVKLSLGSNEAIRELVAGGMGWAILTRHALPADPAEAGVQVVAVEAFPLTGRWYVVHSRQRSLSLPAQAFRNHLLADVR